jgi:hypothetical protein
MAKKSFPSWILILPVAGLLCSAREEMDEKERIALGRHCYIALHSLPMIMLSRKSFCILHVLRPGAKT